MKKLSRRKFVIDTASAGAAIPLLALLGACKSESGAPAPTQKTPEATASAGPTCDLAQLSDADKAPRTALAYVDQSTDPAKSCDGCSLYIADNGGCPGCKLFRGPVEPSGTCSSWAPKA